MLVACVLVALVAYKAHHLHPPVLGDSREIMNIAKGGTYQIAYRLRRPLPIFVVYVLGLGQPKWMTLAPIGIFGALLLIWVLYDWIDELRPGKGYLALVAFIFPGTLSTLAWFGPNTLGLALGLLGWRRKDWRLLAAAGLIHETFLIFAIHRKKVRPILIYGIWALAVSLRYGWGTIPGTFGFLSGFHSYQHTNWGLFLALATLAIGLVALIEPSIRWLAAGFLIVALCMGQEAWGWQSEFTRLLLPLWVLGFIAIIQRHASTLDPALLSESRPDLPVAPRP